jgi:hypothetical protein
VVETGADRDASYLEVVACNLKVAASSSEVVLTGGGRDASYLEVVAGSLKVAAPGSGVVQTGGNRDASCLEVVAGSLKVAAPGSGVVQGLPVSGSTSIPLELPTPSSAVLIGSGVWQATAPVGRDLHRL